MQGCNIQWGGSGQQRRGCMFFEEDEVLVLGFREEDICIWSSIFLMSNEKNVSDGNTVKSQ
jgi:hypothetical protein